MKRIFLIIGCLFLFGCTNEKETDYKKIMENNDYVIIDVRSNEEYNQQHVKGAINIPYTEINENISIDKDKVIFVYCKSGNRSGIAYSTLKDLGYEVYDLKAFSDISLPKE